MNHSKKAANFIKDEKKTNWHDQALWYVRQKRDTSVNDVPEWKNLRDLAHKVKAHTLTELPRYLDEFEKKAESNGIHIHWAADAAEHNSIVGKILRNHHVKKLVKSKSMLTEECHLNEYLEKQSIEVIDTDLGERIIQLSKELPSHIVLPAIHKRKEEISVLFHEQIGTELGNNDPTYLTKAARHHLRMQFLSADAALTGINFAVAETGGFVVCTNEGNADMGVHLAPVHIASMGIEKVIPKENHLGIFLRLLARSATGQPITTYSSHFRKPAKGKEIHVIIVDNGRSEIMRQKDFYQSLYCIRCGACMNTCPVYRRSGGHSYDYIIPGPIGSILSPHRNAGKYSSLPYASSLCGSCTDVCPVKIDIHAQLYQWRQKLVEKNKIGISKKWLVMIMGFILKDPDRYHFSGKLGRKLLKWLPRFMIYNRLNVWGKQRELPNVPENSFYEWYLKNRR